MKKIDKLYDFLISSGFYFEGDHLSKVAGVFDLNPFVSLLELATQVGISIQTERDSFTFNLDKNTFSKDFIDALASKIGKNPENISVEIVNTFNKNRGKNPGWVYHLYANNENPDKLRKRYDFKSNTFNLGKIYINKFCWQNKIKNFCIKRSSNLLAHEIGHLIQMHVAAIYSQPGENISPVKKRITPGHDFGFSKFSRQPEFIRFFKKLKVENPEVDTMHAKLYFEYMLKCIGNIPIYEHVFSFGGFSGVSFKHRYIIAELETNAISKTVGQSLSHAMLAVTNKDEYFYKILGLEGEVEINTVLRNKIIEHMTKDGSPFQNKINELKSSYDAVMSLDLKDISIPEEETETFFLTESMPSIIDGNDTDSIEMPDDANSMKDILSVMSGLTHQFEDISKNFTGASNIGGDFLTLDCPSLSSEIRNKIIKSEIFQKCAEKSRLITANYILEYIEKFEKFGMKIIFRSADGIISILKGDTNSEFADAIFKAESKGFLLSYKEYVGQHRQDVYFSEIESYSESISKKLTSEMEKYDKEVKDKPYLRSRLLIKLFKSIGKILLDYSKVYVSKLTDLSDMFYDMLYNDNDYEYTITNKTAEGLSRGAEILSKFYEELYSKINTIKIRDGVNPEDFISMVNEIIKSVKDIDLCSSFRDKNFLGHYGFERESIVLDNFIKKLLKDSFNKDYLKKNIYAGPIHEIVFHALDLKDKSFDENINFFYDSIQDIMKSDVPLGRAHQEIDNVEGLIVQQFAGEKDTKYPGRLYQLGLDLDSDDTHFLNELFQKRNINKIKNYKRVGALGSHVGISYKLKMAFDVVRTIGSDFWNEEYSEKVIEEVKKIIYEESPDDVINAVLRSHPVASKHILEIIESDKSFFDRLNLPESSMIKVFPEDNFSKQEYLANIFLGHFSETDFLRYKEPMMQVVSLFEDNMVKHCLDAILKFCEQSSTDLLRFFTKNKFSNFEKTLRSDIFSSMINGRDLVEDVREKMLRLEPYESSENLFLRILKGYFDDYILEFALERELEEMKAEISSMRDEYAKKVQMENMRNRTDLESLRERLDDIIPDDDYLKRRRHLDFVDESSLDSREYFESRFLKGTDAETGISELVDINLMDFIKAKELSNYEYFDLFGLDSYVQFNELTRERLSEPGYIPEEIKEVPYSEETDEFIVYDEDEE